MNSSDLLTRGSEGGRREDHEGAEMKRVGAKETRARGKTLGTLGRDSPKILLGNVYECTLWL